MSPDPHTHVRKTNRLVGSPRVHDGEAGGKEARMEHGLFARLGRFAVRRRWLVIGVWAALLVAMGTFAGGLSNRLTSGGFEVPGSPSLAVQHDLQNRFSGQYPYTALVVIHSDASTVDAPAFRSEIASVAARVQQTAGVGSVQSVVSSGSPLFVSPDHHTTYLIAGLKGDQNAVLKAAGRVMDAAGTGKPLGVEVGTGGGPAFYRQVDRVAPTGHRKA